LAAIAIPKLFGMTAKAKASEVGPAAGTWSKLQQAYVTETSKGGNFKAVGYTPPGDLGTSGAADPEDKEHSFTTNFNYSSDGGAYDSDGLADATAGWTATPRVALNNCTTAGLWEAEFSVADNKVTEIKIENVSVFGTPATGDCGSLTPQFGFLK